MALNKRRSLGSASASASSTQAPVSEAPAKTAGSGNSDFTAIQTALEAIVNSIAELAKKIESTQADQAKLAERLDAIEVAMEEDATDGDDEGVAEDEDEDGEDVTPDDIDFAKVSTILHDMGDDEQKEVLSAAMKKLGVKRLRLPDLRKNPEQLFAVAEVLNEDYEVDVDDMLK